MFTNSYQLHQPVTDFAANCAANFVANFIDTFVFRLFGAGLVVQNFFHWNQLKIDTG